MWMWVPDIADLLVVQALLLFLKVFHFFIDFNVILLDLAIVLVSPRIGRAANTFARPRVSGFNRDLKCLQNKGLHQALVLRPLAKLDHAGDVGPDFGTRPVGAKSAIDLVRDLNLDETYFHFESTESQACSSLALTS